MPAGIMGAPKVITPKIAKTVTKVKHTLDQSKTGNDYEADLNDKDGIAGRLGIIIIPIRLPIHEVLEDRPLKMYA